MAEISTALIAAVGAAALLAALAFRNIIETVIRLNDELQEGIQERHANEREREALRERITVLETQLAAHVEEIRQLKHQLEGYTQLWQQLRSDQVPEQ